MSDLFFERPILNSPYECPDKHWELEDRQPVRIVSGRRRCDFLTPVPRPRGRSSGDAEHGRFDFSDEASISTKEREYYKADIINELRRHVEDWRNSSPGNWLVTPVTRRLLEHWRHHEFGEFRPFFCQIEAVETAVWLTEVAPRRDAWKKRFWTYIVGREVYVTP